MTLLSAIVLAATPVLAAAPPPSDDEMRQQIEEEMAEEDLIDVKVSVKDRAVTLSGSVPNASAARRAMERAVHAAEDADESAKVVNRLKVAEASADEVLARAVQADLLVDAPAHLFDRVDVQASRGAITLRGVVADGYRAKELVARASRVPGVQHVLSEIELLSPEAMDGELRLRIAGAIYGDPAFARYREAVPPPVQVEVRGGRVVLSGVVGSEPERGRAEALARAVPGHRGIESRLTVGP